MVFEIAGQQYLKLKWTGENGIVWVASNAKGG